MSFPKYPKYKDSGVEWLGEVPDDWEIAPLRRFGFEREESNEGLIEDNLLSLSYGRIIRKDIETLEGLLPESFETYQIVHPDDIIFRLTDLQNDKRSLRTALVRELGIITFAYVAFAPTKILPGYLSYLLRDYDLRKVFYSMGGGVRQSMKYEDIRALPLVVPGSQEQASICAFLDQETAKIDALIEEQRRLIELLKEKRQAVISHAVTKGLDRTINNNLGNAWYGNIPVHWKTAALKHLCALIKDGTHLPPPRVDEGIPLLSVRNMIDGRFTLLSDDSYISEEDYLELCRSFIPSAGDVLLAIVGATLGKSAIIPNDLGKFQLQRSVAVFRTFPEELRAAFLNLVFRSQAFQNLLWSFVGFSAQPGIYLGTLASISIPCPPVKEQDEIVAEVVPNLTRFEALIEEADSAINLLQERRSALISAAVTGKIDVRGAIRKPVQTTWQSGFARQVLAAEALRQCNGPTMGRIKLQKLIHLCEYHAQLEEIAGNYSRKAAGPFDSKVMAGVRKGLKQQKWFEEYKDGSRYAYRPMEKAGAHEPYLAHWADKKTKIDQVLGLFRSLPTRTCEIASTLYAAWNDLLLEGKAPTDDEIIHEASSAERWHESKEKIAPEKWPKALAWMRANALVPVGYGAHTKLAGDTSPNDDQEEPR